MEWNDHQLAIFDFICQGEGDGVVKARAGTGKTTTMCKAAELLAEQGVSGIGLFAFNKAIAKELGDRLERSGLNWKQANARTLHSAGFKVLRENIPGIKVNQYYTRELVRRILCKDIKKDFDTLFGRHWKSLSEQELEVRQLLAGQADVVCKLVNAAKWTLCPTDVESLQELAFRHCLLSSTIDSYRLALYASKTLEAAAAEPRLIDYTDMVWLPEALDLWPRFRHSIVMVDEAQDMNAAQLRLARKHVRSDGRFIVIGDDCQAIYGWRGASSRILNRMAKTCTELTLPVTYRCGTQIVEECQNWVADFEAGTPRRGAIIRGASGSAIEASPGDYVLSRTNAPLVRLAIKMLAQDTPVAITGRDIAASMRSMIRQSKASNPDDLLTWLDTWVAVEIEEYVERGDDEGVAYVEDRAEVLRSLSSGVRTVQDIEDRLDEIYRDDDPDSVVTLSTVHRAKGSERDNVYILSDTFMRHGPEEDNVKYVAVSRARDRVIYCGPSLLETDKLQPKMKGWG